MDLGEEGLEEAGECPSTSSSDLWEALGECLGEGSVAGMGGGGGGGGSELVRARGERPWPWEDVGGMESVEWSLLRLGDSPARSPPPSPNSGAT